MVSRRFRGVLEKCVQGDITRVYISIMGGLNKVVLQWEDVKMPPWRPFARSQVGGWKSARGADIVQNKRVGGDRVTRTAGRMEIL